MFSVLNPVERQQRSAQEMRTSRSALSWVLGGTFTLALSFSYAGAAVVPFPAWVSSVGIVLWGVWAFRYPNEAFGVLLLLWFTFYSRAVIPMFHGTEGAARGGLGLGDLLWFAYSLVWIAHWGLRVKFSLRPAELLVAILLLYFGVAFLLPLLGVWLAGYPLTYAVPSLRPLQWSSFVLWGYWFYSAYGARWLSHTVVRAIVIASVLHALYALLQMLVWQGYLPAEWLALDLVYEQQFAMSWFYIQRATGLFVNPNTYGLWGATCIIVLAAMLVGRLPIATTHVLVLALTGIWAIAMAASRTAVVGLVVALVIIIIATLIQHHSRKASFKNRFSSLIAWGGMVVIVVITVFVAAPDYYVERLAKILLVVAQGAEADPNAVGRLELWDRYLRAYEYQYPLGSWVPPSYVLDITADNYYLELAVQGTLIYTSILVSLLFTILVYSLQLARSPDSARATIGIMAAGLVVFYGVAGIALSLTGRMELLWLLVGVLLASVRR